MSKPAAEHQRDRDQDEEPAAHAHAHEGEGEHEAMGASWQAAKLRAVDEELDDIGDLDPKEDAEKRRDQRFDDDPVLEEIAAGTRVVKHGDTGRAVTKLQVALMDLGYLRGSGVDGDFRDKTEKALRKYQRKAGIGDTGEFDAATLASLRGKFETRKPYTDLSKRKWAGVHELEDYEKDQAIAAMEAKKPGEKFVDEIAPGVFYGPKVKTRLTETIAKAHKEFFTDVVAKRDKPDENFHKWKDLEAPCKAAKAVTDKVYGSYKTKPAFTHKKGNLADYFEDQKAANAGLDDAEKKAKAARLVRYLVDSQCDDINKEHHASVDGAEETVILDPIIESFVDTDAGVQTILETFQGWPGAARGATIFLQRYKADNDDKNREQMWDVFHTGIHEYIHTLRHERYSEFANSLGGAKKHTLLEGFCDFFTLNVRSTLAISEPLRKQVEGPYYDKDKPLPANADGSTGVGVYASHAQAEQVVSIVGVRNAQEAYFEGDVAKMGAP
jgi:peptidoglycan hydrolase-like protein with peptidoglycan-binding domain